MIVDGTAEVQTAIPPGDGRQQKPCRSTTVGEGAAGDGGASACLNGAGIAECSRRDTQAVRENDAAAQVAQINQMTGRSQNHGTVCLPRATVV